jgi:hypothetical protein
MSKFFQRYYKSQKIRTEGHWMVDPEIVWQVLSSNGKDTYGVRMHDKGFSCECQGFNRHGHCKHIVGIENLITDDTNYVKYAI